jgi:hypothetical protein
MRRYRTAARLIGLIPAAVLMVATTLVVPATAGAATLDVCADGCAFTEIGPALAAATNGDTVRVAAGTYEGGIVINASVKVIGAGAGKTIIKGGGPVVTIGTFGARNQPTVVLRGLTITGGVTHSSPVSNERVDHDNVIALGGGVEIPPSAAEKPGATVTIRDSAIVGNRAAPTDTVPSGRAQCPGGPCPFAWARGGGIDSWGDLTLLDTVVAHNTAAGTASDANGGGISIWSTGSLTLRGSRVASNRAIATVPNGRFAEGGGIFTEDGVKVSITASLVSGNVASLTSNLPYDVGGGETLDMNANGGGIHKGDGGSLTIAGSTFRSNRVEVNDPNGEPTGFDSAIYPGGGPLSITDSVIAANRVTAIVASSADVGTSGTALDIIGPANISGTRITGNVSRVVSESGLIGASGAVFGNSNANQPATIRDSLIEGNLTIAETASGFGIAIGSGVDNEGQLTLRDTRVIDNVATVHGPAGLARGGGIWNGQLITPEPGTLIVRDSRIVGNVVQGDPGVTLEGGGLYTEVPVTLHDTTISGNQPDDCVGC